MRTEKSAHITCAHGFHFISNVKLIVARMKSHFRHKQKLQTHHTAVHRYECRFACEWGHVLTLMFITIMCNNQMTDKSFFGGFASAEPLQCKNIKWHKNRKNESSGIRCMRIICTKCRQHNRIENNLYASRNRVSVRCVFASVSPRILWQLHIYLGVLSSVWDLRGIAADCMHAVDRLERSNARKRTKRGTRQATAPREKIKNAYLSRLLRSSFHSRTQVCHM